MIQIENVTKYYGDFKSLDNICADVPSASIFGMVGSNGSGKSTLLRVMAGVFKSESGRVCYDGEPIYENPSKKAEVIYLSDDWYFLPHATINDMMRLYSSVYEKFDFARYEKLCKLFNLNPSKRVSTFSKGMQKQTALLLALAARPKYLLCDETFDGLDPVMRQIVKKLLAEEVATNGMTAIIASHNLRELEDICDHIALLHKGGLLFESEIDTLKENIHTVQVVLSDEGNSDFEGLDIVSGKRRGSMYTLVLRGAHDDIEEYFEKLNTKFFEVIPLTLEEIFICEMEERGYDCSNILL